MRRRPLRLGDVGRERVQRRQDGHAQAANNRPAALTAAKTRLASTRSSFHGGLAGRAAGRPKSDRLAYNLGA